MVSRREIQRYCTAIAAAFKPSRIILFGSHAYGKPDADSDVDVLVVMPGAKKSDIRIATQIREKIEAGFPVDLLVRGEKEVARRVKEQDLFMLHIMQHGRPMYEAVHE
jgi:predicted nucleotidyltransferase